MAPKARTPLDRSTRGRARLLFEMFEGRDAAEVLSSKIPAPIEFVPHREFVRETLVSG